MLKKGKPGEFFEDVSEDGYYISGYYGIDGNPIVCEEFQVKQLSIFDLGVDLDEKR